MGSLIGVIVSIHHQINPVLVEKRLVDRSKALGLLVVVPVRVIDGGVELDKKPGSGRAIVGSKG